MNHQQSRLEIIGFDNEPILNTFHQQAEPSSTLGLVFPGIGYTMHMPVMYYSSKILLDGGLDVLEVEYNYRRSSFQNEPEDERLHWILTDASNAYHAANARGSYKKLVAVGKSIGTIAMLSLLDEPGLQPAIPSRQSSEQQWPAILSGRISSIKKRPLTPSAAKSSPV